MAEMIIMLRRDPQTGKQNITVKLNSDADALPYEHEQMHRELVQKLVGRGLDPEDLGELIIEREGTSEPASPQATENPPERRKEGQSGR